MLAADMADARRNPDDGTYALLYDEARAAVERQSDRIDAIRTRAALLLVGGAAIVAGFVVGQTLAYRSEFSATTWVGVFAFGLLGGCTLALVLPWRRRPVAVDLRRLLADVEGDDPSTLPELHRRLVAANDETCRSDERWLNWMSWIFFSGAASLVVEVIAFLLDLRRPV